MSIGEQLRMERLKRRISAKEMSETLLISRPTLWRIENGKQEVDEMYLKRYAGIFNCELKIIFEPKN